MKRSLQLGSERLFGVRIGLHHPELVAFRVSAVRQPAHARHWHFGGDHFTAVRSHAADGFVQRRHIDSIHCRYFLAAAAVDPAIDSRLAFVASGQQPVIFSTTIPLLNLPAECFCIKLAGAIWIISADFKMYDSWHVTFSTTLRVMKTV